MTITMSAVYENGVLKLDEPLKLQEKAKVRVTIEESTPVATDDPTGWKAAERFIGIWKDAPEAEPIAREHDKHLYK